MSQYVIAYDLGTGGNKSSLYDAAGRCVAENFQSYPTLYPHPNWHEQRPDDWWDAIVAGTHRLLADTAVSPREIEALGISGHSLGAVPIDGRGQLLRPTTPIWSDGRAIEQAEQFFDRVSEAHWYRVTGNGFPRHLYTLFEMMWYHDHEPELFAATDRVIGTKDFVNLILTGVTCTDHSYASGSGAYDLTRRRYDDELIAASDLSPDLFPDIVESTDVVGKLTPEAAEALGLTTDVSVVAGGVDNSCMALGARNTQPGRAYSSQGSSSWIAVTSTDPIIHDTIRPYVFAHVIPGLFTSAVSTFAAGSSFRWVRDQLCRDLIAEAGATGSEAYDLMTTEATESPPGANGVLFNPSMAGGTSLNASTHIRGAFIGLDLRHTRPDLVRAAMEGIALELRIALDALRTMTTLDRELLMVGGGSTSPLWRSIFASAFGMDVVKTNIDQQAAALGAAACAAVGVGLWDGFEAVDGIHEVSDVTKPDPDAAACYDRMLPLFKRAERHLSDLGESAHGAPPTS